ncbi:MAG: DUF368 domain-containing protein [Nitrospiraceae bacterium]|nr:DUF368 domain-containing protein [Nitrospiraceae bacterium]
MKVSTKKTVIETKKKKTGIIKRTIDFSDFFTKGLFMGSADIVPGISGGTIALIVGIYERLIEAIKGLNLKFLIPFAKYLILLFSNKRDKRREYLKESSKWFFAMDWELLVPLLIGDATALIIGAKLIKNLFKTHPIAIYSFFIGLIIISIKVLAKKINHFDIRVIISILTGVFIGIVIALLSSLNASHTLPLIFLSGLIAICAMILPGISGSYILIILGQYKYMLGVLNKITNPTNMIIASVFIIGALIGLVSFSWLIAYLMKKYYHVTMGFLVGLMLGGLTSPIIIIYNTIKKATTTIPLSEIILSIVLFVIGMIIVEILYRVDKKYNINKE